MVTQLLLRRARTSFLRTAITLGVVVSTIALAPPPAHAGEEHGTATTRSYWGSGATQGRALITVSGYAKDYSCGLFGAWDCASVRALSGKLTVARIGSRASLPNLLKIRTSAAFTGVALDVYVSAPPSLGFHDSGSRCDSPELESRPNATSVSYSQSATVCTAKTIGYVRTGSLSATGYYRLGDGAWRSVSTTTTRKIGA